MPDRQMPRELYTGIEAMDDQHARLFRLIGDLHRALQFYKGPAAAYPILAKLRQYAEEHFREEEVMLEAAGYPNLARQRKQHAGFTAKVADWERAAQGGAFIPINVYRFLHDWLYQHIQREDMAYATCIRKAHRAS